MTSELINKGLSTENEELYEENSSQLNLSLEISPQVLTTIEQVSINTLFELILNIININCFLNERYCRVTTLWTGQTSIQSITSTHCFLPNNRSLISTMC